MNVKITPKFWSHPDIENATPEVRLAVLWLMTNSAINLVGYVKISEKRFVFETGLNVDVLERACTALPKTIVRTRDGDGMPITGYWLPNFIRWQFGRGPSLVRNTMCKTLCRHLMECDRVVQSLVLEYYPELKEGFEEGLLPDPHAMGIGSSKRKRERRRRSKRSEVGSAGASPAAQDPVASAPEGLAEVVAFGRQPGAGDSEILMPEEDAKEFFNHYEGTGWKKSDGHFLKSWKDAARKWMQRDRKWYPKKQLTTNRGVGKELPFDPKTPHAHTGGIPVAN